MSDEIGWYAIELTADLVRQGTAYGFRREFMQRYHILLDKPKTALLLANDDPDNPKQPRPAVLYYYLSPVGVQIMGDLLYPNGARDCAKPSPDQRYFVAGDKDYFLELQATDGDKGNSGSDRRFD